jgi:glyoxylase-like metal-dependent hydrolase (beta-lactamase superfamily II)
VGLSIHALDLGHVTVDSSFLAFQWNPGTPADVACYSYLILGSDTPILVDTSYTGAAELRASSGIAFDDPTPDQTLERQLAKFDLLPEDIGVVINTHLHADHTGLTDQLTNARIIVQRSELQFAAAPFFPPVAYNRADILKYVGPLFERIEFVERNGDMDVAPGVTARWTGGHTPGHQMVYVETDSGLTIITGDLVYRKEMGVDFQVPPGYVNSMSETTIALAQIKRDAKHVLPMHDPNVIVQYPDGVS